MDVYFCSENILFSEIPLSIETATRAFLQATLKLWRAGEQMVINY